MTAPARAQPSSPPARRRGRRRSPGQSLRAGGEPYVWITGTGLVLCVLMTVGLLTLVVIQGVSTFWPGDVVRVELADGSAWMGEVTRTETYRPEPGVFEALPEAARAAAKARVAAAGGASERRLVRIGNFELTQEHFRWVSDFEVAREGRPEWACVVERLTWGRFYGTPVAFVRDGAVVAEGPAEAWRLFEAEHEASRERWRARRALETHDTGVVNRRLEAARLDLREVELRDGADSAAHAAARERYAALEAESQAEFAALRERIDALNAENARHRLRFETADGQTKDLELAEIVRAYPANRLGFFDRVGVYLSRTGEFLTEDPREANSEGGVFPAIFGTLVMTLLMTLVVVPFGVLAALFLREYARAGWVTSTVRVAVNNLAGVPSIVFGVFGLGFFCYVVGGHIDQTFFAAKLPSPTYGTGGILWASLTLALLTLPVVIVATEEALAAVPRSMREGSLACGATKWQTIRRIVLPRAMPGVMTGAILAMARGAGEVAPLMLVGAVKLAPELPVDGVFPYVHPERSFMHLGFHIYDLGFQSQNSEAAKPMVFTTTLLLISIIVLLNLSAIVLRNRLRRRFEGAQL